MTKTQLLQKPHSSRLQLTTPTSPQMRRLPLLRALAPALPLNSIQPLSLTRTPSQVPIPPLSQTPALQPKSPRPSSTTLTASTSSPLTTLIQLRFRILTHRSSPSFQADLAPLNASKPRTARTHSAKLPLACLQLSWL